MKLANISRPFTLLARWSVEIGGSDFIASGRRYRKLMRIGYVVLDCGEYDEYPAGSRSYIARVLAMQWRAALLAGKVYRA